MPSPAASRGDRIRTGFPFQRIWPRSGGWMPAMHLIVTDLPAPLSPIRAVTWPAGISKFTSESAWTGPKFFETPLRRRRGSAPFSVLVIPSFLRVVGRAPPARGEARAHRFFYEIPAALHALAN